MKTKIIAFLIGIISLFSWTEARAWGRWGIGLGNAGVHVSTQGGVGVSLPTPQASIGVGGGSVGVSATATPSGIGTNVSGPQGVSAGADTNGHIYGGATHSIPGGASGSGYFDENGVGADVTTDNQPLDIDGNL